MSPEQETLRSRMHANPFVPSRGANGTTEERMAHAAEYSAFYLGVIVEKLNEIAAELKAGNSNSGRTAAALTSLTHTLPQALARR